MLKFIHAADPHLHSPLRGLERYDGAPKDELRVATRQAFIALVDLALEESVDLLLIAGDLYDGSLRDFNAGLFFIGQMNRLREAGIPVVLIAGNHDAANKMTRSLKLPDNVTRLDHERPQSKLFEGLGVAVHGQSFAKQAVTENLSTAYPKAAAGLFNIGLLHTCLAGREGHERYAPCSIEGLLTKGYDYWALGHVHEREVFAEEPYIAFAGNLQGRHIREQGAKGCLLVTVGDDHRAKVEFRALDVVRWQRVRVDASTTANLDEALEAIGAVLDAASRECEGRTLAARVELAGASPAHGLFAAHRQRLTSEIRALASGIDSGHVWIEKVVLATAPLGQPSANLDGPIGTLRRLLAELRADPSRIREFAELDELASRVPAEVTERDSLRFDDPAWLASILEESEPLLVERLRGKGDGA